MPLLHQMHVSGNCYKIRQLGVPLTLLDYPLHGGETRQAPYLAKNPNGRVPLLELDDGRCLPESGAILWYLSEGTDLQPADRWGRAQALQWMFFEQYSHEPYIAVARFWLAFAPRTAASISRVIRSWFAGLHAWRRSRDIFRCRNTGSTRYRFCDSRSISTPADSAPGSACSFSTRTRAVRTRTSSKQASAMRSASVSARLM
jgi:hypothetical protein